VRATPNPHVQLTGTGSCVGSLRVGNDELERMVHGYDAARSGPFATWVDQVTHIHERPYAPPGTRTSDLAIPAAAQALEMAGLRGSDLGLIIYASFTPSHTLPGDHCLLAQGIGAARVPTFNLMAACAGSVYALAMAYGMVASGATKHVLVVGAEVIRPQINFHDPLTAILFGDGAGAAVISRVEGALPGTGMFPPHLSFEYSPTAIMLGNSNNPHDLRCFPPTPDKPSHALVEQSLIVMNGGPSVLKNAVNNMAECTVRTLGYALSDLRHHERPAEPELRRALDEAWLIPHQANGRIVEGLKHKLAMPKVVQTVYRYGNMSAASNLVALDHLMRRGNLERVLDAQEHVVEVREVPTRAKRGELLLLPSIGGGYLMGCVAFRLGCAGEAP
jgi:3-oxoacyl-[acyl-carrier-protein] synthase-3